MLQRHLTQGGNAIYRITQHAKDSFLTDDCTPKNRKRDRLALVKASVGRTQEQRAERVRFVTHQWIEQR